LLTVFGVAGQSVGYATETNVDTYVTDYSQVSDETYKGVPTNFYVAYFLKEFDVYANENGYPNGSDWVDTFIDADGKSYLKLDFRNMESVARAAEKKGWQVSYDYLKPMEGAIVLRKSLTSNGFILSIVRSIDKENKITMSYLRSGKPTVTKITLDKIHQTDRSVFVAYIYPTKK